MIQPQTLKTTAQAEWEARDAELVVRLNYWNNREQELIALLNDVHQKIGSVQKLMANHRENKPQ